MKAKRSRGIAVLIKLGWVFSATLRPLYPNNDPVPLV